MSSSRPTFTAANLPPLPPRVADSHKGNYGKVLVVGGSRGMAGAIALCGMAALRSGAGLVRLGIPETVLETVAGFEASLMTFPLPADEQGRLSSRALGALLELLPWADVVALGPGLGRSEPLTQFVRELWQTVCCPLVVDADGLFALAELGAEIPSAAGPRVITPHAGEFARLLENESAAEKLSLPDAAADWASRHKSIVLLKGPRTLVTDGQQDYINATGNPGMATGGMGDVLTGVIAALIGQGLTPFEAASCGAHIHGLAGDLGAAELGQISLIASDMLRFLPAAFQNLSRHSN